MARTVGSDGGRTLATLKQEALRLIARHGYEAVSMRALAAAVGVQPAALYRYYPHKEDLLFALMRAHMETLLASWSRADDAGAAPAERLGRFVSHHIGFHLARRDSTHVSNLELRSLSAARREHILGLRTRYEDALKAILRAGERSGSFTLADCDLAAMAIIQMITGVVVWFRAGERYAQEEIVHHYHIMTRRLVGAAAEESHV